MMISNENMLQDHFYNSNPTVHIPPWSNLFLNQTVDNNQFPLGLRHLATNPENDSDDESNPEMLELFSSDQFRMFDFKVRNCTREKSHDWSDCPYAHPGEKARRRDPRKFVYSGTACPEYRKGSCKKGDGCELGHGVFECWLHPNRYRTQACKDGLACKRRVCFFAHTPEQLRIGSGFSSPRDRKTIIDSYDGSPLRNSVSSPVRSSPVMELMENLRQLQLGKVNSLPNSWRGTSGFGSPRGPLVRSGFSSMPTTPTQIQSLNHLMYFGNEEEIDEPVMERVESGRDLRAKMFEKLRNDNSLDRVNPDRFDEYSPDFGWVSDLVT